MAEIPEPFIIRVPGERKPFQPLSDAERLFNRGLIAAEECQRQNYELTAANLHLVVRELTVKEASFLMTLPKFIQALDSRGIALHPMAELTAQQRAAISLYFSTGTTMTHAAKLKVIGVTPTLWRGWLAQPAFAAHMERLSDDLLDSAVPLAKQRLFELVDAGNVKAIDRTLAWRGGFDYRAPAGSDINAILMAIFEILDEERVPVGTMKKIADRVRGLTEPAQGRIAPKQLVSGEPE